jgi:hypothetical protein
VSSGGTPAPTIPTPVSAAVGSVFGRPAGSRPRVEAGSLKPTVVAVAEVLAGLVPYVAS